jgi:hypothetical protein
MNNASVRRILLALFAFLPITASAQLPEIHKSIVALHDEVMNYINNLPKQDGELPPPPSMYFDYCFPCDKERQAIYVRDSTNFMNACYGEDTIYLNKASTVLHFFASRREFKFAYDTVKGQQMEINMLNAKIIIAQRVQTRLVQAWSKYGGQDEKIPFLVYRMREMDRLNQLWGVPPVEGMHDFGILEELLLRAKLRALQKAKEELDYRVLLNGDWIFELFRTAEAMGISPEMLGDNIMNYAKIDWFVFTIETKAKIRGTNGAYYSANLSSKQIFTAKAGRDCHLKWSMGKETEQMKYQLNELRMVPPKGEQPLYVGDKTFVSPQPDMRLDFCDNKRDTAHFYAFKAEGKEMWEIRGMAAPAGVSLAAYMIAFPDNKVYSEYARGGVGANYTAPFGFYVKQVPKNNVKVILEKTIFSKDVTPYPQYVDYGEFKLKIEHVE